MADTRDIVGIGIDRAFRVRAESLEDLEIISALLQDAIVPISEISFQRRDKRFVLMAQRFRWEKSKRDGQEDIGPDALGDARPSIDAEEEPEALESFERVTCALRFEHVTGVRVHGLDLADRSQVLELLSIHVAEDVIDLAFAGGKTIRLSIANLSCHAEDIGEAWPTTLRPNHPGDEE
jgi:hypothetical protein